MDEAGVGGLRAVQQRVHTQLSGTPAGLWTDALASTWTVALAGLWTDALAGVDSGIERHREEERSFSRNNKLWSVCAPCLGYRCKLGPVGRAVLPPTCVREQGRAAAHSSKAKSGGSARRRRGSHAGARAERRAQVDAGSFARA